MDESEVREHVRHARGLRQWAHARAAILRQVGAVELVSPRPVWRSKADPAELAVLVYVGHVPKQAGECSALASHRVADDDRRVGARLERAPRRAHARDSMDRNGASCFPSLTRIQREANLARSTVCSALDQLESARFIARARGGSSESQPAIAQPVRSPDYHEFDHRTQLVRPSNPRTSHEDAHTPPTRATRARVEARAGARAERAHTEEEDRPVGGEVSLCLRPCVSASPCSEPATTWAPAICGGERDRRAVRRTHRSRAQRWSASSSSHFARATHECSTGRSRPSPRMTWSAPAQGAMHKSGWNGYRLALHPWPSGSWERGASPGRVSSKRWEKRRLERVPLRQRATAPDADAAVVRH